MVARTTTLLMSLVAVAGLPAAAQVRELGQGELRQNVQSGKSLPLSQLMPIVAASVTGEIVDVRAFDTGRVVYRILVKQPGGKLAAVVLDAGTGRFLRGSSSAAKQVMAAAKSANGNGKSGGKGKSGNNGNGNGNSGGNGNGNSGGNGNGNSGGNGNGNGR